MLRVKNGIVDLRTGELIWAPRVDFCATVDVDYDRNASTAFVDAAVCDIMGGDAGAAAQLQKLMGYAISGEVDKYTMIIFVGCGQNGKGAITQSIQALLGPRFCTNLMRARMTADKNECRLCVLDHARPCQLKAIAAAAHRCHRMVGGPKNQKHAHVCTIATSTCDPPIVSNNVIRVYFPVTFTTLEPGDSPTLTRKERDITFKWHLQQHKQGWLKWLVDGAMRWFNENSTESK